MPVRRRCDSRRCHREADPMPFGNGVVAQAPIGEDVDPFAGDEELLALAALDDEPRRPGDRPGGRVVHPVPELESLAPALGEGPVGDGGRGRGGPAPATVSGVHPVPEPSRPVRAIDYDPDGADEALLDHDREDVSAGSRRGEVGDVALGLLEGGDLALSGHVGGRGERVEDGGCVLHVEGAEVRTLVWHRARVWRRSRRRPGAYAAGVLDQDVSDAYDARATEYAEHLGALDQMAAEDVALVERWRDATMGTLLDAGCGPGHWTDLLHDGHRDVVGVDLSAELVSAARARFPSLTFRHGSYRELPVGHANLGGILAWYSLIHAAPDTVPAILGEFASRLRPRGHLLLGYFDGEPGTELPHRVVTAYHWSAAALGAALDDAGFQVIERHARQDPGRRPHGAVWARLV